MIARPCNAYDTRPLFQNTGESDYAITTSYQCLQHDAHDMASTALVAHQRCPDTLPAVLSACRSCFSALRVQSSLLQTSQSKPAMHSCTLISSIVPRVLATYLKYH